MFKTYKKKGCEILPWKEPEKRREYRRKKYAEDKENGITRDWGKVTCICPICNEIRELSKNNHRITKLTKDDNGCYIKRCRSCSKTKEYAKYNDREYVRDISREKLQQQKVKCIQYMGSKCQDCGLEYDNTNANAFDFHHINPEEKEFNISSKYKSFKKLKIELEKCELLCAICHRKIHSEEY